MKEDGDYRPVFEMINEDKIQKHIPTIEFDFNFEVNEYQEAEENTFDLEIYPTKDDKIDKKNPVRVQLKGVCVIDFYGETEQCSVVVSNSIIHQYIGNKKQHGKHYFYFYIKEDAYWIKVDKHIWLDEVEAQRIGNEHGTFTVKPNEKINLLGLTGMI